MSNITASDIPSIPFKMGPNSISTPSRMVTDFVDLNASEYHIDNLKYCRNISSLINDYSITSLTTASQPQHSPLALGSASSTTSDHSSNVSNYNNILIFDLSPNESTIPSLFTVSSPASSLSALLFNNNKSSLLLSQRQVYKFHLNLPSTLLRRNNFKFENLLQITFTDEKRNKLLSLINNSNVFIFFDKFSKLSHCSVQTYSLIRKFEKFLKSINIPNYELILLSLENSPNESNNTDSNYLDPQIQNNAVNILHFQNKKKNLIKNRSGLQNFNLTITIPKNSAGGAFVRSIKKDSIHYSPDSLQKYFSFKIPQEIELNDQCLPVWLRNYTDKTKVDKILLKLLESFELLEDIEIKRLSLCLNNKEDTELKSKDINSIPDSDLNNLQSSESYHKIYSLSHLQKRFKKSKSDSKLISSFISTTPSTPSITPRDTTLIKKKNNLTGLALPPLVISTAVDVFDSKSKNSSNSESNNLSSGNSETLLTPLFNYEVSQGIQSFNKNRYSNILPYEHSRVKLQYSPIIYNQNNSSLRAPNNTKDKCNNETALNTTSSQDENASPTSATSSSSSSSSTLNRKRKSNSYFSLNYVPQYNPSYLASKNLVSPTSSISSCTSSPSSNLENEDGSISNLRSDTSEVNIKNLISSSEEPSDIPSMGSSPILRAKSSKLSATAVPTIVCDKPEGPTDKLETRDTEPPQFNDYFNANYLVLPQINPDFKYIATQAPLPSTIDDFWKVVMSNKIKVILSLNSDDELQLKKWDIYWGSTYNKNNSTYTINLIKHVTNIYNLDGCTLRIFQALKRNGSSEEYCIVYQLQYSKWLDSCSIDMGDLLKLFKIKNYLVSAPIKFLSKLELPSEILSELTNLQKNCVNFRKSNMCGSALNKNIPLLVHCSAGCGRTGVFITLDFLINILSKGKNKSNRIDVWNMNQDLIFIVINELRKQRLSMVQNLTQFISCYESMLRYFSILKSKSEREISKGLAI